MANCEVKITRSLCVGLKRSTETGVRNQRLDCLTHDSRGPGSVVQITTKRRCGSAVYHSQWTGV